MKTGAELSGERREPRCLVCKDAHVRRLVDHLLDWVGTPVIKRRGKFSEFTYADVLRSLEPLNQTRDKRDRITYNSLWNHANRHYGLAGIATYWRGQVVRDVVNALRENEV
jgi:hypothetical protein